MNYKTFINSPITNKAEIARQMFPTIKLVSAKSKLNNKAKGEQGRKFNSSEEEKLHEIWLNLKLAVDGQGGGELHASSSRDEIIYKPEIGKAWKIAGFSRVEEEK